MQNVIEVQDLNKVFCDGCEMLEHCVEVDGLHLCSDCI